MSLPVTDSRPDLPALSVVVCSYNGADRLPVTMSALAAQTARDRIEVIVVDDGSSDETAQVAQRPGVRVIVHERNRGQGAARNTGLAAARAPYVAFTDDDCEPVPTWAEDLLRLVAENADAFAVGGRVVSADTRGLVLGFLDEIEPLAPVDLELGGRLSPARRLGLYLARTVRHRARPTAPRRVASLAGANATVKVARAVELGGFDERFSRGGEDEDLFRRALSSGESLVWAPVATVRHHFDHRLRSTLRRARTSGRGNARMVLKYPEVTPIVFPAPIVVGGALLVALARPRYLLLAAVLPQLLFPKWPTLAATDGRLAALCYPYLQLAQEAWGNVGFVEGVVSDYARFRGQEARPPQLSQTPQPVEHNGVTP